MRWFAARRNLSIPSAAPARWRSFAKGALFALACLAGLGMSGGPGFEARAADDGGMMSFLLSSNSGGRSRAAAPVARYEAPVFHNRAPSARRVAVARQKARTARATRMASMRRHAKAAERIVGETSIKGLIHKASLETASAPAASRAVAETLALKAAAAAARPEDSHLRDKTLRSGDIVATKAGLKVFLGSEQFPYRARDFAPVSSARNVAQRNVLEALDRSLRGIRSVASLSRTKTRPVAVKAVEKVADQPVRRVDARPAAAPQTIAMAYAPKADAGGKTEASAIQAIERVVRRIDLPAARAPAAGTPTVAANSRTAPKKTE